MTETKHVTRLNHTISTSEEMADLQTAVKNAGGVILGITALRNGQLSVTVEIDADKRQF